MMYRCIANFFTANEQVRQDSEQDRLYRNQKRQGSEQERLDASSKD